MVPTLSVMRSAAALFRHLALWSRGWIFPSSAPVRDDVRSSVRPAPALWDGGGERTSRRSCARCRAPWIVVGDGPQRVALEAKFPEAVFTGTLKWGGAARCLSQRGRAGLSLADRYVRQWDRRGHGRGTPVAAYPVMGLVDIIRQRPGRVLDGDLRQAVLGALAVPRAECDRAGAGFYIGRSSSTACRASGSGAATAGMGGITKNAARRPHQIASRP